MSLKEAVVSNDDYDPAYLLWAADICDMLEGGTENAFILRDAAIAWYEHRNMQETVAGLYELFCKKAYRTFE